MSNRTKRQERNLNKGQQPRTKNQLESGKYFWRLRELLSPTGKFAASVALFLTIAGAYYAFSSKLSIYPTASLDPAKPFATPFVIKNDSLLSLSSIKLRCRLRKVIVNDNVILLGSKDGEKETTFNSINIIPIPFLAAGEESTLFLPFPNLEYPITFADISAEVEYSPALLPFKKKTLKRFVTVKASDGTFHWVSQALSE
jgi:hypothetical protein